MISFFAQLHCRHCVYKDPHGTARLSRASCFRSASCFESSKKAKSEASNSSLGYVVRFNQYTISLTAPHKLGRLHRSRGQSLRYGMKRVIQSRQSRHIARLRANTQCRWRKSCGIEIQNKRRARGVASTGLAAAARLGPVSVIAGSGAVVISSER